MSYVSTPFGKVPAEDKEKWDLVAYYMKPLLDFYADDEVTEIMVNRADQIFVEKRGQIFKADVEFDSEDMLVRFIQQLANALRQEVSADNPILHARFPDQSRACCTLSSISPIGSSMTLRVAPKVILSSRDLVDRGAMSVEMVDYLRAATDAGANIIVAGGTGSGKTTVLRMLAEFIDEEERVITCEDTQELFLRLPNTISLEAPKRRNVEGVVPITLANLIETSLRMRPDRILVGEIRDGKAADAFLQAINTGHSGCCTSIHANNPVDAIQRIQYLIASSGLIGYDLAGTQLLGSIDVIVQAKRSRKYGRKIAEIVEIRDKQPVRLFYYDVKKEVHVVEREFSESRYHP